MLNASGYSVIVEPGKRNVEHDTISCAHCGKIEFTRAGFGPGGLQVAVIKRDLSVEMRPAPFCRNCYRHICPRCEGKDCVPLEKKIDIEESAARKGIIL